MGVLVLAQFQKGFGSFVMTSSTEVSHVEDTEKGFLYMSILVVHARHHGLETSKEAFFHQNPNFWAWADNFGK